MRSRLTFSLLFFFHTIILVGQTSRIAGKVIDQITGQPLEDVHIFIPNTTFQAFSDSLGNFFISSIPDGKWEVQVWGYGWNSHRETILLKTGIQKNVEVKLAQTNERDPSGEKLSKGQQTKVMDQVMEAFVGSDFKKREIALLNPDKLLFERLEDKNLRVHSVGPIFFSNNESGYLVSTYFKPFILGSSEKIQATYSYFELPRDGGKMPLWHQERMKIYGTPPAIRFRGGEPLVLINGAPVNSPSGGNTFAGGGGQTAFDAISNLDVFSIERVEVIRRLVPQYGDLGRNGIISFILKTGLDRTKAIEANMNNYTIFKLNGYPQNQTFEELEKSRAEFPFLTEHKPTLYWNPNLVAEEFRMSQQIEFQLNEKAGPIWVEIKGITDLGEPIYGSFLLNDTTQGGN
jgi:hypothetical protein